jgi:protoheme IX farnesyltransferase
MAYSSVTAINKSDSGLKSKIDRIINFTNILSELTKFKITFFVSVTTFVGYILHNGKIDLNFMLPALGVLILASGASALNEYQERNVDSKMERTSSRPIPSGRILPQQALFIAFTLIILGSLLLFLSGLNVLFLGLFTLIWYNAVYTPLKKRTSIAILPGSLVGALPPVIGWAASGGSIWEIEILSFAAFMFIWQIPHFWLLLLMYDSEYKKAGFPTLSNIFSIDQITKITYFWIAVLIASSSLFYFSGLLFSAVSQILLLLSGIITFYLSFRIIKEKKKEIFGKSFLLINSYVLFILIVISIENTI